MKRYIFYILFHLVATISIAQEGAKPFNISALYDASEDQIKISYEISNSGINEVYDVSIEAYRNSGAYLEKLNISSISGDLKNVNASGVHNIFWKQRNDGYVFNEDLTFKIYLSHKPKISYTKHLIKSAVFPGWGDYKIGNGKHYVGYGLIGYSLVASSIVLNQKAVRSYDSYLSSYDISESNKLFNDSKSQYRNSILLGGTAALVWSIDLANVYYKVKRAKKDLNASNSKYYYEKSLKRSESISLKFQFNTKNKYDIALEEGDKLFKQERYKEALAKYSEAKEYNPSSEIATKRKTELEQIVKNEEIKQANYTAAVNEGNRYLEQKEFTKALSSFEEASRILPKEQFTKNKITEIKQMLADQERDKNYAEAIRKGDEAQKNNLLDAAIGYYDQALELKPSDPLATEKKNNITKSINTSNYQANIRKADAAFKSKDYQGAIALYEDALSFLPNEDYPAQQIIICNKKLEEIQQKEEEAAYKNLITKADAALKNKNYDDALVFYQDAQQLFQDRPYPTTKINQIKTLYKSPNINTFDIKNAYENSLESVLAFYENIYDPNSQSYKKIIVATGFIFTENGFAITNKHVYDNINNTYEVFNGKEESFVIENWYKMDDNYDYAIFKLKSNKKFKALKTSEDGIEATDPIWMIQNPLGLSFLYKKGDISTVEKSGHFIHSIPTDGGSSGSPIFNMKGEVIGLHHSGLKGKGQNNFGTDIRKIPLYFYK